MATIRARIKTLERSAQERSEARIAPVLAGGPADDLTEAELDSVLAQMLARLESITPGATAALVAEAEAGAFDGDD